MIKEIVIKIDECILEHLKDGSFGVRPYDRNDLIDAVMNGTPLPEHGRLIDADKFKEKYPTGNLTLNNTLNRIIDAEPTVLEGSKE